jgi:alkylation response protein AidB-like acyl-CoA dehydrogenase
MNLNYTPEELEFRKAVRAFLEAQLPADIRDKLLGGRIADADDIRRWQRILHAQGWGGSSWPAQFGGPGWNLVQQYLFEQECALAGAPAQLSFGVKMLGPVLMRFGSSTQQQYFLPRILSGEHWWCQGYSEPGAGSDLASLKTRAARAGDDYVVNGQKAWNTLGQHADWMFCLVRTDPSAKPQRGISFLLIDMKTPGITVRPTSLLDGTQEVNEIWLENVRVPVANRVGEENQGWTYAKFLLGHERTNIAGVGLSRRELARLKSIATEQTLDGRPLIEDRRFRARIAQLEIELTALEITNLRVITDQRGKQAPGPEASILKIRGTEIMQAITELMIEAVGPYALPFSAIPGAEAQLPGPEYAARLTATYLNRRKLSIFGGSNEIQKNIISQMILGL